MHFYLQITDAVLQNYAFPGSKNSLILLKNVICFLKKPKLTESADFDPYGDRKMQ